MSNPQTEDFEFRHSRGPGGAPHIGRSTHLRDFLQPHTRVLEFIYVHIGPEPHTEVLDFILRGPSPQSEVLEFTHRC